jgi:hypothetical protein
LPPGGAAEGQEFAGFGDSDDLMRSLPQMGEKLPRKSWRDQRSREPAISGHSHSWLE